LRGEILQTYLDDNVKARLMGSDGTYTRVRAAEGQARVDSQLLLMEISAKRSGYEPGH
jgi:polyphosphate kinase